ncbi:MAG: EutN/CcmL family microcompartment protein [Bdellovibrionota bacterium]
MILAKVISRVVATAKSPRLPHRQLLSVEPLPGFGDPNHIVAIDAVEAGPGDTVLVLQEGTGARQAVLEDPTQPLPAQMVIVGVVDQVERI